MIISQAGIGSVLKQSCNDSDDEEDMEMVEESDVYGVTTVLNLTQNKVKIRLFEYFRLNQVGLYFCQLFYWSTLHA